MSLIAKPTDFIKRPPNNSVFKKAEHEYLATDIFKLLVETGNEFRLVTLEEFVRDYKKISKPWTQAMPWFNFGSIFHLVAPYLESAEKAASFSPVWQEDYNTFTDKPPIILDNLPLPTDKEFFDSPDAGDRGCLCSRCGKKVEEWHTPLRMFDEQRNSEYRYHWDCVGGKDRTKAEWEAEQEDFFQDHGF